MSGFVAMHRDSFDHPLLKDGERFRAWFWLVSNACWKPAKHNVAGTIIELERGQLAYSIRHLAGVWGWSKSAVERFLTRLETETMIERKAGHGKSVITICNYAKYQDVGNDERDDSGTPTETKLGHERDTKEQGNQETNKPNTHYAFFGRIIKLNAADLERWRNRYHAIGDLEAQLGALDDWLTGEPAAQQAKWFNIVSGALNKRHQDITNKESDDQAWGMPIA